ncbi:hypothetical protein EZ449_14590 [Pedobacter frigidisoli]|uniref:Uncharacterized protein n=1 Tax=Pedobacter frigidisoli TaxID=2530455 RepID=A0A4R0NYA6_9SPHI|nr:hypothetical protein [Pedobacter frigidisoli]TCD07017.1 hypothetical protein EZ449_14590 [Pedobacter frigidisoli]
MIRCLTSPATKALVVFTIVQVSLLLIFNFTGRLSLAKIFGVSAIQCLMLGITLKVFCTIVLEAIYLQTEAYQSSRFSDFINYKELQHRLQRYLWVIASVVFFISFVRNITLYDLLVISASDFIYAIRSIGSYDFGEYAIGIRTLIWVADLSIAGEVRTEAMIDVKSALSGAGINLQVRPLS